MGIQRKQRQNSPVKAVTDMESVDWMCWAMACVAEGEKRFDDGVVTVPPVIEDDREDPFVKCGMVGDVEVSFG